VPTKFLKQLPCLEDLQPCEKGGSKNIVVFGENSDSSMKKAASNNLRQHDFTRLSIVAL
jgi:hypothetical protein